MYKNLEIKNQELLSDVERYKSRLDTSRRKLERLEKDLEEEKHYSESLFEALREGCLVLDENLRVKSANQSFYKMFNVTPEETDDRYLFDLGNRQWDIPDLRNLLEKMLPENKEINDYEISHDFEEIGQKVMVLNARHIDHLHLILLAIEDVTERKSAIEEIRKSKDVLEERVEERTRQVRNLAKKITQSEQEERHRISSILHDDVQQILVAIHLRLGLLFRKTKDTAPQDLREELLNAKDLTDQAVEKTRQLTGDLTPVIQKTEELTDMLEWLVGRFDEMYDLKVDLDVRVNLLIQDEPLRVVILQTVRELLFNIVKHARTKEARIEVRQSPGDSCFIHVSDNGVGFDMDMNDESFGLFNLRERLNLFGGKLQIESTPGEGTHVEICLPDDGVKIGEYS